MSGQARPYEDQGDGQKLSLAQVIAAQLLPGGAEHLALVVLKLWRHTRHNHFGLQEAAGSWPALAAHGYR
jgi:hypothetical protein